MTAPLTPYDREQEIHRLCKLVDAKEAQLDASRRENRALHRERIGEVWYWQGDEFDTPESLSCPVLMEAETVRQFVTRTRDKAALEAQVEELLWVLETVSPYIKAEYGVPTGIIEIFPENLSRITAQAQERWEGMQAVMMAARIYCESATSTGGGGRYMALVSALAALDRVGEEKA